MKVLILSASTGAGHMSAANALSSYITQNQDKSSVKIVDTLEYISSVLNKTVVEGYHYMALKVPKLFGTVYNATNKKNSFKDLVSLLNSQFSKKLLPLLESFNPDIIVTTHPFPTEMVSNLKQLSKVKQPLVCIMTDYSPHQTWINENVDRYIVASESMKNQMIDMGVDQKLVFPFGIPVNSLFYQNTDKQLTLKNLGLDPNTKTILIMAGSMGATQIFKLYKKIVNINVPFQVIVITGNNRQLYKSFKKLLTPQGKNLFSTHIKKIKVKGFKTISSLKASKRLPKSIRKITIPEFLKPKDSKPTKLIFFTKKVYKYMQASDLIVTKPGGLTTSEALACNVPMALFDAIPGPENENADFFVSNGMAIKISESDSACESIKNLLSDPSDLEMMKRNCKTFSKPLSTRNIFSLLETLKTSDNIKI